jgi:hypothetical protein
LVLPPMRSTPSGLPSILLDFFITPSASFGLCWLQQKKKSIFFCVHIPPPRTRDLLFFLLCFASLLDLCCLILVGATNPFCYSREGWCCHELNHWVGLCLSESLNYVCTGRGLLCFLW